VIDGALYMSPPPNWSHQRSLNRLNFRVSGYVFERGLGDVVTAPTGLILDDENGIQPDLIFVSNERSDIITEKGLYGAPDLVVEVLSPSTRGRDLGIKLRRYAAAGVPHYWTLDLRNHTLIARRLGARSYEMTGTYGPGEVFRPDLFPGLEIPKDDLWA
jgi:Uma2 family endonuclease